MLRETEIITHYKFICRLSKTATGDNRDSVSGRKSNVICWCSRIKLNCATKIWSVCDC